MEIQEQVWRMAGRVDGHDQAFADIGGKVDKILGAVGAIEERQDSIERKLDKVIGTGMHPTIAHPPQPATEPITKGKATDRVVAILNSPKWLHTLYGLIVAVLVLAGLAASTGRSAYDLVGVRGSERSGITLPAEEDRNPRVAPRATGAKP